MVTNLCFGLICLLIPVMIELFILQDGLRISNTGHTLVEALILLGMFWLFMQILRLDEWLYLRNFMQQNQLLEPEHRRTRCESPVQPMPPEEPIQVQKPKATTFHWLFLPLEYLLKNHRTAKL